MKKLNIGMIGYGFMGRTHSNAFSQVNHFFDLQHRPVLKALCARSADDRSDDQQCEIEDAKVGAAPSSRLLAHLAGRGVLAIRERPFDEDRGGRA